MSKLQRLTGKIFGSSATATGDNPQIGQFGSALASTYNGTTDVATIQSLPAWQKGFIGAVTPNTQFPPLPEMTGFGKVLSHQICYLLQQGVPEYDNDTTYYDGNWCSYQKKLYFCINDNSGAGISGFLPTNVTYWTQFTGGSSRNLGEYVTSSLPLNDPTLHLADGSQLSSVDYPELFSYIASIYSETVRWQTLYIPQYGLTNAIGAAFGNNIQMFICENGSVVFHTIGYQLWSYATITSPALYWRSVTHGNSCFMALSKSGLIYKTASDDYSGLSNWSSVVDLSGSNWSRIAYGNGTYVALTKSGETSVSTDNGANWSTPASAISSVSADWVGMIYDGTQFVAISDNGYISTSQDGIVWTTPTQVVATSGWVDIAFDGTTYMAIASDGSLLTSTNLTNWSTPTQTLPSLSGGDNWAAISPSFEGFFAVTKDTYVSEQEVMPASPFVSEADWQATNTAYGECGQYVYNSLANTLRIPKLGSYFKNTTTTSELGDLTPASAPNIKATFSGVGQAYYPSDPWPATLTGSVYRVNTTNNPANGVPISNAGSGVQNDDVFGFDASRSSSVYSDSATTVNTQSIKQLVYIVVAK